MLSGKRIAVFESRVGAHVGELIARAGGIPVLAPALAEEPDVNETELSAFLDASRKTPPALFIFQTGVGTVGLWQAMTRLGQTEFFCALLASAKVAVRGPKPTAALRARQVRIDFSAASPYTTAELLAAIALLDLRGQRVAIQRYGETNAGLTEAMHERGAIPVEMASYRWALPVDTTPVENFIRALQAGEIDAAVFTSAAQIRNLQTIAAARGDEAILAQGMPRIALVSIGPVCSAALRKANWPVAAEADPPKLGGLIAAVARALGSLSGLT